MIDDDEFNKAAFEAAAPMVNAARQMYGPLLSASSTEFLTAPLLMRQAVLLVIGIARCHQGDPVRALLREVSNDIHGGDRELWRNVAANHVSFAELVRRRAA